MEEVLERVIKSEEQILADKKAWVKSLWLWKKIKDRVRIVRDGDQYSLQKRTYLGLRAGWGDWEEINMFSTYKQVVQRRNMHVILVVLKSLNIHTEYIARAKKKKWK